MTGAPPKKVPCPACGKLALFSAQNKWRPFCGERCKTIDLGDWAAERYRVASGEKLEDSPEKGSEQISSESPPKRDDV